MLVTIGVVANELIWEIMAKTQPNLSKTDSVIGVLKFTKDAGVEHPITAKLLDSLYEESVIQEIDQPIYDEIYAMVKESGQLPFGWTPQEQHYLDRQPQSKWLGYLIYRYKFRLYPERLITAPFPTYVLIEPASVCNLRCPMCFQVDRSFTRKPYMGLMDLDMYKNVIDQLFEGETGALTMGSRGEPTMHPKLSEMVDYAAGKFYELKLITNATRLTEALSHSILASGTNIIVFSVDAHEKALYEEIRVNGDFDEVYGNIIRFHQIRDKYYSNSPIVTRIAGVKVRAEQDADAFTSFWGKIADEVAMKDAYERWDTYNNNPHPELTKPCRQVWERMYIWFDGTVNPCDADYKSMLTPGNVKLAPIREIWHGSNLERIRSCHSTGKRGSLTPCDRCGIC